jgi:hypothetical protein
MASRSKLRNAFSREYLDAVQGRDEPATSHEAETSEPWELRKVKGQYGFFRPWERSETAKPPALFDDWEIAMLFRVIWPALGRERMFRLNSSPTPEGFPVEMTDRKVGHMSVFDPDAVFGAHMAGFFVGSSLSLAFLLWVAGPTVQEEVGEILGNLASGGEIAGVGGGSPPPEGE